MCVNVCVCVCVRACVKESITIIHKPVSHIEQLLHRKMYLSLFYKVSLLHANKLTNHILMID